jgi:hypothetical protein
MTSDGYSCVTFMKMMPYYSTPIEEILRKEGRLKTINGYADYDFLNESLNLYFQLIIRLFSFWMWHPDGLLNASKWARTYLKVFSKYYGTPTLAKRLQLRLSETIAESNSYILNMLEKLSLEYESGKPRNGTEIIRLKRMVNSRHNKFLKDIKAICSKLFILGKVQDLTGFTLDTIN